MNIERKAIGRKRKGVSATAAPESSGSRNRLSLIIFSDFCRDWKNVGNTKAR